VQCRALHELDWQRYGFDEIQLIVCRPIQAEIDHQKNKAGDRLARRARDASSLFREIILGNTGNKIVRESNPSVKLLIEPQLTPADGLNIDYSRADDRLVGIAAEYQRHHPDADVRVLTHDTGPMATARTIGVGLAPIPDEWLRPPEPSEADKTIKNLHDEIARLKLAEPVVETVFVGPGDSSSVLEGEVVFYEGLARCELDEQMERIRQSFPIATDFSTPKPPEQPTPFNIQLLKNVYEEPSEQEISQYRSEYSLWLRACEKALKRLNTWMQQRRTPDAQFCFESINRGTRPARDVLVTILAKGNFEILPTQAQPEGTFSLPSCPKPPRGIWGPRGFAHLEKLARQIRQPGLVGPNADLLRNLRPPAPRDPNRFYWKPKPSISTDKFVFECAQWRHGSAQEGFAGEIWFEPSQTNVTGALECIIQAENLSSAERLLVPVRMNVVRRSILDAAREAVDRLILSNEASLS
jgi:PIN domain